MSKTLSIRLPDDVADWLEHEANQRGRTKTDLIVSLVKVAMEGVYDAALQSNTTQHDATQVQDKIDAAIAPLLNRLEALEGRTIAPQPPAPPAPPAQPPATPSPPQPPAPPCRDCGSLNTAWGGYTKAGSRRVRCKDCGKNLTPAP